MTEVVTKVVAVSEDGIRLDRWFRIHYPYLSHGRLEKFLRKGQVRLDGRRAKASARIIFGQVIRVPPTGNLGYSKANIHANHRSSRESLMNSKADGERIRSYILYQDNDLIAINKPSGLAVQGGSKIGKNIDSLLDGLRFDSDERPRLVHRLDKDTSGVLLLGRTSKAAAQIAKVLRQREVRKIYWAITMGTPKPLEGTINVPLAKLGVNGKQRITVAPGGKTARTAYRVMEVAGRKVALVELSPETGRTHQLRVHMADLGTPILGDGKYGSKQAHIEGIRSRLHLHARSIELYCPEGRRLIITAPLPAHMIETWKFLGFSTNEIEEFGS